ncbi:MAG: hypothetical protein J3K34DRAFT_408366 [Monoraphidium minutum]|nr:MAG: hypothetical protein J3K34DRAFT_408366 [Monoraphidium minutum]
MLLLDPDQLPCTYPYPDTHLLRRRARVNPAAPDFERFPLARRLRFMAVTLSPGDALFFPAYWAHHTESLGESVSVTCRLEADGGGGGG